MNKTTWQEAIPELLWALLDTFIMVSGSFVLTLIFGLLAGIWLRLSSPDGLRPNKASYSIFGTVINLARSLPFLILLIVLIPVTRLIVGTAYGSVAAIVPLAVGAIPFYARVVESALREVPDGKVEAAVVFGARVQQIVTKVLIPEAMPGLVAGATLTLVTLIGYSTMAGAIGGGGVGDFAIKYGYQRFNTPVLLMSVVILIILVQVIQSIGDAIVRSMNHRR